MTLGDYVWGDVVSNPEYGGLGGCVLRSRTSLGKAYGLEAWILEVLGYAYVIVLDVELESMLNPQDSDSNVEDDTKISSEFLADLNVDFKTKLFLLIIRGSTKDQEELVLLGNQWTNQIKLSLNVGNEDISKKIDEESLSLEDEGITTIKAFMAIAEDEPAVGKTDVRNKARLVTQGYRQEEEIDYDETFTLVARLESIRIYLAYFAYMGFVVYQMDVNSAFPNEKLSKEVYVQQPPGFESIEFPNYLCKLDKALYGMKQAPRAWYETLSKFFIQHKFVRGEAEYVADAGCSV
nr:retrovirus-related Pol polyprotein from transposon TNT 1-94 [Tanacetum cinerariifolium]